MAGADTGTFLGGLKRRYGTNSKIYQQNLEAYSWGILEKAKEKPSGQGTFHMTYMNGNESGNAINENQALSVPQSSNPQQPFIKAKIQQWPFQFSGLSMAASEGNEDAFIDVMDAEMTDANDRCLSDLNRQFFGDGNGILTQVNGAVVASATVVVDDVQYLRVNQDLDFFTTLGGAKEAQAARILTINVTTNTITLNKVVTLSDNAIVVKTTVQDAPPADGKELAGLARIIDTTTTGTTFQGIDRSVFTDYQSNVIAPGAVPLSQALLQRLMNRIMIIGGKSPTKILSRHGVYASFVNTSLAQTRYQDDVVKAGHVKLTWNGLEWLLDKDCQTGTCYMLNMNPMYLAKYVVRDIDLARLDTKGQTIDHVDGFDKFGGYYVGYLNMGSKKPNVHGKLTGLLEPAF